MRLVILPCATGTFLPLLRVSVIANGDLSISALASLVAETSLNLRGMNMSRLSAAGVETELAVLVVALPAPVLSMLVACLLILWTSPR